MARISLKSIIAIDGIQSVVSKLNEQEGSVCIRDNTGKILFGLEPKAQPGVYPVYFDNEMIGSVEGNENAAVTAGLLNHMCEKETEKKKLGSEILNLYKEINLIFNFSEKLAKTIDAPSICIITLNEAMHVIDTDKGAVILRNEADDSLLVAASTGDMFFNEKILTDPSSSLYKLILSGQSEIVTGTDALQETGITDSEINSLVYAGLKVNDRVLGAIILAGNQDEPYTAAHLKLLTTLALQSSAAVESALLFEKNIRESKDREDAMRLIYEATGKFVPYEFIRSLGHNVITDVKLGDQVEKIVTVLFSDIRGYTTLSEKMTPEENFRFVCSFNEKMGPAIRKNNGFINQYLGDAIMAIFPRNASDALSAAIDMQKAVDELNVERTAKGSDPIRIGVGMHTGPLIMGITGDLDRMDATTISDTVNTASRLESLTKHYKATIIISDACMQQMKMDGIFYLRYLGIVQLKGKHESLHIHECFNGHSPASILKKQKTLSTFNTGIKEYLNSSYDNAVKAFQSITEMDPEDLTAVFFLETAMKYIQEGETENRPGVIEMVSK